MKGTDRFRLTFVAADDKDPPVAHRIRQLLKHAGRALGLRCVCAEDGQGQPIFAEESEPTKNGPAA